MILAGSAMLTGVILASFLTRQIDSYWLSLLPGVVFMACLATRWRWLWLIIFGFLWFSLHIHWQLHQRLADELNNNKLTLQGEVFNIPRTRDNSTRFLFRVSHILGFRGQLPNLVRLNWRNAPAGLLPGQRWTLQVKLKRPHGFQNPAGFDYERWLMVKGIHATGYVLSRGEHRLLGESDFSLNRLRAALNQKIAEFCAGCDHTGLIQALALGYRGNIGETERDHLQQTGTAHLIAISGLHIGIIAAWFYLLASGLWGRLSPGFALSRREFAISLSWLAALAYSLLSGFDVPAQRAMLMLSIVAGAVWLRLPVNLLHSIFSALLLILILSPLSVLSSSLWLTFSALLVISLGALLLANEKSALRRLFIIQLLFSLFFIPLSIIIFQQVHVASLLANLVAVPLISLLVVPFNFVIMLAGYLLPDAGMEIAYAMLDKLLHWLISYLQFLQQSGLQARFPAAQALWTLLLSILLVLALVLPRGLFVPRAWLLFLPLVIFWPRDRMPQDIHLATLDVGMGTSVVVQTRHHSLVYDFGPGNRHGYSLGKWVVLPYLQQRGIDFVDRVVISHADQDHLGGFYAISRQLQHGPLFSGTAAAVRQRLPESGVIQSCHAAQSWTWDGVSFEFLSAGFFATDSENNRSCVLKIRTGKTAILIAGDIEARQEQRLIQVYGDALQADILVAPHHGSLTSSTPAFIDRVKPKHVIFTSGYLNRWQFPRAQVVARYADAQIHRTDRDGAILLDCENNHCALQSYRALWPRLWY